MYLFKITSTKIWYHTVSNRRRLNHRLQYKITMCKKYFDVCSEGTRVGVRWGYCFGVVRRHTTTFSMLTPNLWRHMAPLGHNDLSTTCWKHLPLMFSAVSRAESIIVVNKIRIRFCQCCIYIYSIPSEHLFEIYYMEHPDSCAVVMGLLSDTWNSGLRMRRDAGNVFPATD